VIAIAPEQVRVAEQTAVVLPPIVRKLGLVDYNEALGAMRRFTAQRGATTPDELWLLEHPPVYTLGQGADEAHGPRSPGAIPVLRVERGGEVTYHGPGQLVVYTLVDIGRSGIKVREFVRLLEQGLIDLLGSYGVRGERKPGAPGVYVAGAKVAALGVRISRGCALHGLALNIDMDLAPFSRIDPCGYPGLAVTQTRDLGIAADIHELGTGIARHLLAHLGKHHA
jgi:lipoyl(octanoyl) transferase